MTVPSPALGTGISRRSLVAIGSLIVVSFLAACTPGDGGPTTTSTEPPAYLTEVDANGLIGGKPLSQVKGVMAYTCIQEAGWVDFVLSDDGSFSGNVPPGQEDQYDSDLSDCYEEADKAYPPIPMSDRAIRERYALELATRDCLIEQGLSISEPPSEQAWVEQFNGSGSTLWLPYWEALNQSVTQAGEAALYEACPDPANRVYLE